MNTYILTDSQNLFYRQINMTNPALGVNSMVGMAFHMILYSMKKEFLRWGGTHTVMFREGRSWRKDIYPDYKGNRKTAFAKLTPKEQETRNILSEAFNEFMAYIDAKTNISVLRHPNAEADDMIYVWIDAHPDDRHILVSSDSDFLQLLRYPNFSLYDPVKEIMIRQDGVFNERGQRLSFTVESNAKIKVGKLDENHRPSPDWYEYALFLKCIRGDDTDNIFSAYPGARQKGTKKNIGIMEAFEDRQVRGYNWNNFMLQRWTDHNQLEHRVRDRYELNRTLIDLTRVPDNIKQGCVQVIAEETTRKDVPALDLGLGFMKFCGTWDLQRIGNNAQDFLPMLKAKYQL